MKQSGKLLACTKVVSAIEKSDINSKSANAALSRSDRPKKMSERHKNKAIILTRRKPNISIAEITSDLNTTMDAHQVT